MELFGIALILVVAFVPLFYLFYYFGIGITISVCFAVSTDGIPPLS